MVLHEQFREAYGWINWFAELRPGSQRRRQAGKERRDSQSASRVNAPPEPACREKLESDDLLDLKTFG